MRCKFLLLENQRSYLRVASLRFGHYKRCYPLSRAIATLGHKRQFASVHKGSSLSNFTQTSPVASVGPMVRMKVSMLWHQCLAPLWCCLLGLQVALLCVLRSIQSLCRTFISSIERSKELAESFLRFSERCATSSSSS
jgi:hypothetical protein